MPEGDRKKRILDAASDLVVRYGYDKTTVREIADAAGISKGAIYLHFDSKKALFEALLVRETKRFSRRWLECIEADPQGGTIGSLLRNTLQAQQSSELLKAIYRQDARVLGSYLHAPDNLFESAYTQSLHVGFIEEMQKAGVIRGDLDSHTLGHVLDIFDYGFVSIAEVKDREEFPPQDETIEMIAEIMDRALTPPGDIDREAGKEATRRLAEAYNEVLEQKIDEEETEHPS